MAQEVKCPRKCQFVRDFCKIGQFEITRGMDVFFQSKMCHINTRKAHNIMFAESKKEHRILIINGEAVLA